ncbi:hypothetical protein [Actinomadura latina]|uniref:hypothetical protein n=1 Tax=Actinomadura latina TaxID=163603 RepID=UPI0035E3E8C8
MWLLVRCVSCDRTSKLTVHHHPGARPQQEPGAAPSQVRHSAAPSDEHRVHLHRAAR